MSKKKRRIKNTFISIFSLMLGLIVGFVGEIFFSLPDSYRIPSTVVGTKYEYNPSSNISEGAIDVDVINSEDISFHFIELGNKYTGDCIYIKCGDTDILVDGGSRYDSIPYICNYVDSYMNDDCLDYIFVTHAHQDHYAGYATPNDNVESIFDHYRTHGKTTSLIIDFAQTNQKSTSKMYGYYKHERSQSMANSNTQHFTALECFNHNNDSENKSLNEKSANRYYKIGEDSQNNDILLQILYTKYYDNLASTENDYSVCFQIIQGTKRYLFTGDLEAEGEESLVECAENNLGKVELYKAGHHGSKTSSSDALLNVIQPEVVVVCCCAGSSEYTPNNNNQFPTQDFINRVSPHTENIYVTTLCIDYKTSQFESFNGTIVVTSKGKNQTRVLCSNNSTLLKDTEWFSKNRTLPENAKITA